VGGLAQTRLRETPVDREVGVGEGDVGGLGLARQFPAVVHAGDGRPALDGEFLDRRRRHRVALALDRDDQYRVVEVVLADGLADAGLALARLQLEVDEDELAGVGDRPARDRDGDVAIGLERDDVVAAFLALLGARALRRPRVRRQYVGDLLATGVVDVTQEESVEVDGRGVEQRLGVPVGVYERLVGAVTDQRGELRVTGVARSRVGGLEVVVEGCPSSPRHEVLAVQRHVADHDRLATQTSGETEVLEEVEPLRVALGLVVADDGEEGDAGVVEPPECVDYTLDVHQPRPAVVKEVAGVDDGVRVVGDRVVDHRLERSQEVLATLRRVVLPVADVRVGRVNDPGHHRRLRPTG